MDCGSYEKERMSKINHLSVLAIAHRAWWLWSAGAALGAVLAGGLAQAQDVAKTNTAAAMSVSVHPIGHVRRQASRAWIVLEPRYQPGLRGLEGFSHIHVLWWFHHNDTPEKRATLQVHPRGNPRNPLTGVFATRSPARPNLIGLTLCRIVSIEQHEVEIEEIDALDGTPVLDIKPFIPAFDTASGVRGPDWIKNGFGPLPESPKAGRKLSAPGPSSPAHPPPRQ